MRMCKLRFLTWIIVSVFCFARLTATETTTFYGDDIADNWVLSELGETGHPLQWSDPDEKGLPIEFSVAGYYPWIISSGQYYHVTKVEIEVYSEYSRLGVTEVRVGNGYLDPQGEYGYDENYEKSFVFAVDDGAETTGNIYIGFSDISNKTLYLKSLKVTFEEDGSSRELSWSVNSLTINIGEPFDNPVLTGQTSDVVYSSSNPEVARISQDGQITPIKTGETLITAYCPAIYPWQAGECSYTLNVKINLTGSGSSETITLTNPGTLRDEVSSLESVRIRSIKVSGPINSQDISYLRETTGRFSNLQEIDLSDATIDIDNLQYATLRGKTHDIGMGYDQYVFILSDENRIDRSSESTGLGGGVVTYTYYNDQLAGAFSSLTNLKRLILPAGFSSVAPFVAAGCSSLVSIELPENYSIIGEGAFSGCQSLPCIPESPVCKSVGKDSFSGSGISVFDFSSIETIGESAFNSTNIGYALDLSPVKTIESEAFNDCKYITSVSFGNHLTRIGDSAFEGCSGLSGILTIPSSCIAIGSSSFYGTNITSITIPQECIEIGVNPFLNTPWFYNARLNATADEVIYLNHIALAYNEDRTAHPSDGWSITLSFKDGTTTIADGFRHYFSSYGNDKITSLHLPSTLKRIGNNAFQYILSKTEELELPENLESIGENAFYGCGVGQLTLNSNINQLGDYAFGWCNGLVRLNYNVPNAVGEWIFASCNGLEAVKFGKAVRNIPDMAFFNCQALTKFEFDGIPNVGISKVADSGAGNPPSLEIGESVFSGDAGLSTITLPSGLSSIGKDAFDGTGLKTIYCYLEEPIDIDDSGIFSKGKETTIYVAKELEEVFTDDISWGRCNIIGSEAISGIDNVIDDNNQDTDVSVYSLDGVLVYRGILSNMSIPKGIYVLITEHKTYKIII